MRNYFKKILIIGSIFLIFLSFANPVVAGEENGNSTKQTVKDALNEAAANAITDIADSVTQVITNSISPKRKDSSNQDEDSDNSGTEPEEDNQN